MNDVFLIWLRWCHERWLNDRIMKYSKTSVHSLKNFRSSRIFIILFHSLDLISLWCFHHPPVLFDYLDTTLRLEWHSLAESGKNPFACLHSGNENDFFMWIVWERLFHLGWMRTAFSPELNEDDFFIWVEWGRLFHLS
jgi:hypothetical protein